MGIIVSYISFNQKDYTAGSIDLTEFEFQIINQVLDWIRKVEYGKLELTKHQKDVNITSAVTHRVQSVS
jgi:hypothetical protein